MLDLSDKQVLSIADATKRINIWQGAVRSGKSFAALITFIKHLMNGPAGDMVIVGRTQDTIKRNIVNELMRILAIDMQYYSGKREIQAYGRTIHLIGASDERAEGKIRGSTFSGALVDEATLLPESFFFMLLSRLSVDGSKLFITTNPDSPFHWLKTKIIDRKELEIQEFFFDLDDNPSLTEQYKNSLKREYQGLWYQRYIEGKWVLAEGTVYDFFDPKIHVIDDFSRGSPEYYIVGIDYGTSNPTCALLIGYNRHHYPNIWIEKEYYYDPEKKQRQKTDSEFADDLVKFLEHQDAPIQAIYIDPSAASFKQELIRAKIDNLMDANNDVLDGIRFVSSSLANGTLKICAQCKYLIQEMGSYVWDVKARTQGIDKPLKNNDHCFAAGTKIRTLSGQIPIEMIGRGEKVLTPFGYKTVINTFCREADTYEFEILGQKLTCTKDHKFFTVNGWKEASSLLLSDIFLIDVSKQICLKTSSFLMESSIEGTYPQRIIQIEDIIERIKQTAIKDTDISIEMSGNSIMEKFPKATIFITSTLIPQTMTLAISNFCQLANTLPNIMNFFRKNRSRFLLDIATKLGLLPRNGTDLKKEESGIENMLWSLIKYDSLKNLSALNAEKYSYLKNYITQNFVRISVGQEDGETLELTMRIDTVLTVLVLLDVINTVDEDFVPFLVPQNFVGKQNVYNLTIEDVHMYYANNILVANCADALRYAIYTHFKHISDDNMDLQSYRKMRDEYRRKLLY